MLFFLFAIPAWAEFDHDRLREVKNPSCQSQAIQSCREGNAFLANQESQWLQRDLRQQEKIADEIHSLAESRNILAQKVLAAKATLAFIEREIIDESAPKNPRNKLWEGGPSAEEMLIPENKKNFWEEFFWPQRKARLENLVTLKKSELEQVTQIQLKFAMQFDNLEKQLQESKTLNDFHRSKITEFLHLSQDGCKQKLCRD